MNPEHHDKTIEYISPARFMYNKVETGCGFCDRKVSFCNRNKQEVWDEMLEDGYLMVCHHEACIHFPEDMPDIDQVVGITCKRCRSQCIGDCHVIEKAQIPTEEDLSRILSDKLQGAKEAEIGKADTR